MTGPKKSLFQIARMALELLGAIRDRFQRECPNENCPLKLNKKKETKPTQDELIRKQKELYKRNHPHGP